MFDLKPLDTANLISVAQMLAVIFGFYFSFHALRSTKRTIELSSANAQATLFNNMVTQGRDLQHRYAQIYFGSESPADVKNRKDQFTGTLLGYYASCYELRNIITLPDTIIRQYDADLKATLDNPETRKKYESVKKLYSKEFNKYVAELTGGV